MHTKSFLYNILLLGCTMGLLLASNCKPEPKKQKYLGTYPLGDIKDYLYFKPGSMWVYECDSTGELDTQVMVSCDTPWIFKSYIKYQLLTCKLKSINEGSIYDSPFPGGDIFYNENYNYFWQLERSRSNSKYTAYSKDGVFFKPFDTNQNGGWGSPTYYKGLLTNYKVLGQTYDTVRVFQVQTGGTFPFCSIKTWESARLSYYWAKNVGLIRLFVETNRKSGGYVAFNWYLKSYNLK